MPMEPVNTDPPMRIYVGGLTESLADISENVLRGMFPFGEIEYVDMNKDFNTGKCRGFAYIMFKKASAARQAIKAMNGVEYQGKILKVNKNDK
jgi:RNA recognition motif-containing protein